MGVGFAGRKLGLTCDNLRSFNGDRGRVVRQCNPQRNPDLFWACRGGGGGNFGVATRFTFTTHPVSTVTIFRAGGRGRMRRGSSMPGSAGRRTHRTSSSSLLSVEATDSGGTHVGSSGQFFGTSSQLQALLAPFFAAGATPVSLDVRTMPYLDAMLLWAGLLGCPALRARRWGGGADLRGKVGLRHDHAGAPHRLAPTRGSKLRGGAGPRVGSADAYGGAINRVPKAATASQHRARVVLAFQYIAGWDSGRGADPAASAAGSWLRNTYAAMRPHVSGLAYQNYIDAELPRWGLAYYGSNYARLRRVKRHYDPRNALPLRQSIVPSWLTCSRTSSPVLSPMLSRAFDSRSLPRVKDAYTPSRRAGA